MKRLQMVARHVGVHVVRLSDDKTVFEMHSRRPLVPASLVKLITSYAALKNLGPDYRFVTELWAHGRPREGILSGSLWIKGHGDPYLTPERLWLLAQKIRGMGIRRILGSIHVDNSDFDPPYEQLCLDGELDRPHNPVLSATAVNFNTMTLQISSQQGPEGTAVRVFPPTDYAAIRQRWRQRPSRKVIISLSSLGMGDDGREVFQLRGRPPAEKVLPVERRMNVRDPEKFVALTFRRMLQEVGVQVSGSSSQALAVPETSVLLCSLESPPLGDLLFGMNRYSNNFMAEMILRVLGAHVYGLPGSSRKGCRVLDNVLRKLGVARSEAFLDSGSGLSRTSRVSPRVFNTVLKAAYNDFLIAPEFMASLAQPGEDGTLLRRLKGLPEGTVVRGKTGTLKDVVSFSGYVVSPAKKVYAVTVILNGVPHIWKARREVDRFVEHIPSLAG
ncbi:D-alanyl-D-alanine carboxypeptidase/D-alanyl-D-alanine endopeptidase [Desulfacinum hydrothermale]|nr:D-alanyl-D-alanine carboxypeptidase/D-alanyl-D-alanine-endopeptidase [Desulfacinum hydrothermale]